MNFGEALELAKNGKKISREGWNGKSQYIEYVPSPMYEDEMGTMRVTSPALMFVGTHTTQMGWCASQADLLAEDWRVVE